MGMTFPLFTEQMFSALTYKWANMMFGCIAVLLLPLPFVSHTISVRMKRSDYLIGAIFLWTTYKGAQQVRTTYQRERGEVKNCMRLEFWKTWK